MQVRTSSIFMVFLYAAPISAGECPPAPLAAIPRAEGGGAYEQWRRVAAPHSIRQAAGDRQDFAMGVGHLRLADGSDAYYDWPREITLPVWRGTDREFYAWVHGGMVYPLEDERPYPLSGVGMMETAYEQRSLVVWEASQDGWLQIKLRPGESEPRWTHRCHLDIGNASLSYEPWEDLIRKHGHWLHFRVDVPHALRLEADRDSRRITWIGLNHKLSMLEMNGDWMRVRVQQPDWHCTGPNEEFTGTIHEGWVKWRDDEKGPWVWFYTRGC